LQKGLQRRESRVEADPWTLEWECKMAKPVFYLKFSPDGKFFAAAGKYDRLVKVWWRTEGGVCNLRRPSARVIRVAWAAVALPLPEAVLAIVLAENESFPCVAHTSQTMGYCRCCGGGQAHMAQRADACAWAAPRRQEPAGAVYVCVPAPLARRDGLPVA
jgi:hypothetical protein